MLEGMGPLVATLVVWGGSTVLILVVVLISWRLTAKQKRKLDALNESLGRTSPPDQTPPTG